MRYPAKHELRKFLIFAKMVDFLKQEYYPFTAIAREAVRRGYIKQDEVNHYYHIFSTCVSCFDFFDNMYFPEDQTPTGRARYEWKLKPEITQSIFVQKVNDYVGKNFKTPL